MGKGVDMIAANRVGDDLGFALDENALLVVERSGTTQFETNTKQQLARSLIAHIADRLHAKSTSQDTRRAHR